MAGFNNDTFNTHLANPPVDILLLIQNPGDNCLTQQGNNLFELKGDEDFLANGGDGYNERPKVERIVKIHETRLLWEYVKNQRVAKGVISPIIDGRMKDLHP